MWINHPFFKYITGALLSVIFIYFFGKIDSFLAPFEKLIAILFFPILIAGLLYYILRPVVRLFSKPKFIPRSIAILLVFASIAAVIFLVINLGGNLLGQQINQMAKDLPQKIETAVDQTKHLIEQNNFGMFSYEGIKQKALTYLGSLTQNIGQNIAGIVKAITSVATVLIIVPFILFYFLKDDHSFLPSLLKFIPEEHSEEGRKILKDIDSTIAAYILGQMTVALADGILMYIGYLVIGLHYAAILALFVVITAIVPLLGPALGLLPAIVVGLIQDPVMILYILIILVIVQQLEGNLISPYVLGNRLHLHPLTIILLLVVAGALYGFIGILIAVPLYAVLKVTVKNFYKFYQLRQRKN